jgi:hypothetical protein
VFSVCDIGILDSSIACFGNKRYWNDRAELKSKMIVAWLGMSCSKFYDWKGRFGKVNEHKGLVPLADTAVCACVPRAPAL